MAAEIGTRGVYLADQETSLPFQVFDVVHHIYPPADARVRHLDPKHHDRLQKTRGRITPDVEGDDEDHIATTIGTHTVPEGGHGGVDLAIAEIEWRIEQGAKVRENGRDVALPSFGPRT